MFQTLSRAVGWDSFQLQELSVITIMYQLMVSISVFSLMTSPKLSGKLSRCEWWKMEFFEQHWSSTIHTLLTCPQLVIWSSVVTHTTSTNESEAVISGEVSFNGSTRSSISVIEMFITAPDFSLLCWKSLKRSLRAHRTKTMIWC